MLIQQAIYNLIRAYLPEKIVTHTNSLDLSISNLENIKPRGPVSKEIPGGLSDWASTRKFNIEVKK